MGVIYILGSLEYRAGRERRVLSKRSPFTVYLSFAWLLEFWLPLVHTMNFGGTQAEAQCLSDLIRRYYLEDREFSESA